MTERNRKPQAFTLAEETPARGRRRSVREPMSIPMSSVAFEQEPERNDIVAMPQPELARRGMKWAGIFVAALGALISMAAGLALTQMIDDLFARSQVLGWVGSGFLALAGLAALIVILREAFGLIRLKRLVRLHEDANRALTVQDRQAAARTIASLERIYRGRPDVRWGLDELKAHSDPVMAPDDRIKMAERDLMGVLDENALALIGRTSRRLTLLTAITPAAALDILFVAALNLRMLREIATLYGGRPGTLGTIRLARMVVSHLAVTGGLALSDNLVQHLIGRGVLGRLSARFGEGAVNGILTARIGLAAIDLCRPLPFIVRRKPSLSAFIRHILALEPGAASREMAGSAPHHDRQGRQART
jgi:putative membrane protein